MTNPTSNYSFQMPTSTDLVTDLPADFEVFGQAVDTRLKALQPGTTLGDLAYSSATANTNTRLPIGTNGQVLAVVAGVPAWQNGTTGDIEGVTAGVGISGGGTSGTVTVTNSMATEIAAKGDLIAGTGSQTFDNVTVGANGTVLTADSTTATGIKWATPAGVTGITSVAHGSATSSSGGNITITFPSGRFASAPSVLATLGAIFSQRTIAVGNVSSTSFDLAVYNTTPNNVAQSVYWGAFL